MSNKGSASPERFDGTATRYAAERRNLDDPLRSCAKSPMARNDILAEAAGISAGYWYAWPSTHIGRELIAAGMLIMAGAAALDACRF